ncbi:unnamed protein product [Pylaiella littoralis]
MSGGCLPRNRSRSSKSRKNNDKKGNTRRSKSGPQKVLGIFGIPVAWNVKDCTYDDSEDETYAPPISRNSSVAGAGAGSAPATRFTTAESVATRTAVVYGWFLADMRTICGLSEQYFRPPISRPQRQMPARRRRTGLASSAAQGGKGLKRWKHDEGGTQWMAELSTEVVLNGIIRPYLSSASKCALQRTCKDMGRLLGTPEAWETLDLKADVIGRRTMKSGRQSIMSRQPLFFLARSVVLQPRFSLLRTVDMRGLNLGAMGSTPDLLLTLFDSCRRITTLNLWKTYLEDEGMPQPDSSVEKVIAQHLPGVQHLALDMDASNRGLKVLLKGCTSLKSLHIGSRCNRRGDGISMYPNDLGLKEFAIVGAPRLETITLVDKVNIGAVGLRCLLDASTCPRLKTLILVRASRVNDRCLKAIAPRMGRVTSLTLDQCPITPSSVKFVLEKCPELANVVVSTEHGLVDRPEDGRAFLEFLLAQGPTKLSKIDLQRLAPREALAEDFPEWLSKDSALCTAVLGQRLRIVIGSADTTDERIAPFMAGRV